MNYDVDTAKKADALLNEVLSSPKGDDVFWFSTVLYQLRVDGAIEHLSKDEQFALTHKIIDMSGYSGVPLLTAERTDAVRVLLEYGISNFRNLSEEFPQMPPDETAKFLLRCDMEVFSELIDTVALINQEANAPDNDFYIDPENIRQKTIDAISAFSNAEKTDTKDLSEKIDELHNIIYNLREEINGAALYENVEDLEKILLVREHQLDSAKQGILIDYDEAQKQVERMLDELSDTETPEIKPSLADQIDAAAAKTAIKNIHKDEKDRGPEL